MTWIWSLLRLFRYIFLIHLCNPHILGTGCCSTFCHLCSHEDLTRSLVLIFLLSYIALFHIVAQTVSNLFIVTRVLSLGNLG